LKINKKLKEQIVKVIGKENIEFISHSKNYLSAGIFTKALAFISDLYLIQRIIYQQEFLLKL